MLLLLFRDFLFLISDSLVVIRKIHLFLANGVIRIGELALELTFLFYELNVHHLLGFFSGPSHALGDDFFFSLISSLI